MTRPQRFVFLTDLHFGYELKAGHKVALHDPAAWAVALAFTQDYKPDIIILGGDILDCGAISHHNKGKPRRTEGLRILADARDCAEQVIEPLNRLKASKRAYLVGNHEDWLDDLVDENPGIEGLVELPRLLPLNGWTIVPQGKSYYIGKLAFTHGDNIAGGEHVAKKAVIDYDRSVRFGHHHTYQAYTKTSSVDIKLGRTGVAVPCLCTKDPKYGEGKANRWVQGFNYGVIHPDGTFNDTVAIITNGRTWAGGKVYQGD